MASAVDERSPILAGDLSEFGVQALMSAFSLGRQVVAIEVLDARGVCAARIVMKSGRLLSASAGARTGVAAVQHLIASAAPARFRVVREGAESFASAPSIATLSDVARTSGAARPPPPPPAALPPRSRRRVMEGSLSDFDVATILQVASSARQHTVMEILSPQGIRVGSIQLKAGKVLEAQAGSLQGVAAVRQLLAAPGSFRFTVTRALGSSSSTLPLLGAVDEVLLHAASEEPRPWARSGIHLAPPPSPVVLEDDQDEIETLIPPPGYARTSLDNDEIDAAVDAIDALDAEGASWDEIEDEVTRVSDPRARPGAPDLSADAAHASASSAGSDVLVLEGRLSEFDLSSVIQVAGLSRQPTSVRILDDQRQQVGEVRVLSGQVLHVDALGQRERDALRFLLHAPRDFSFSVWRSSRLPDHSLAPLGPVPELLQRASAYGPTLQGDEGPSFRTQVPSLPAGPYNGQTWKKALGVGLILGVAAGAIVASQVPRTSAPPPPSAAAVPTPATPAAPPVAAEQRQAAVAAPPVQEPAAQEPAAPIASPPAATPVPPLVPARTATRRRSGSRRSPAEIASIQGALKLLGCHPGPVDGVLGRLTRTAIATFQFTVGLPTDGELTQATEQALKARMRDSDDTRPRRVRPQPTQNDSTSEF